MKIKKIETIELDEEEPVYDLTVESDNHNFELYNGVFVHNSLRVPKQFFCLRGDTKLVLLNGETTSIKDMFDNKEAYLGKGIMSCDITGKLVPTKIKTIALTRDNANFVRVHLDNDKYLDVTPDHRFMLRDGTFIEAKDLKENDSLMPYYEKIKDSRKYVLDNYTGKYKLQYRLVAENKFNSIPKGNQIHHIDCNKRNDDFDNLANLTLEEYYNIHKDMLHKRNKDSYENKRVSATRKELGLNRRNESQVQKVKEWASTYKKEMRDVQLKRYDKSQWQIDRYLRCPVCGNIFTKKLNEHQYEEYLNKNKFICCCSECTKSISKGGKLSRSYVLLKECDFRYDVYSKKRCDDEHRHDTYMLSSNLQYLVEKYNLRDYVTECNHKVTKIEYLDCVEPAYDIEVESDTHTFATDAGVFIHNCQTDDSTGFNGGSSLSIISSRYGKAIKRVQNTICQLVSDLVNLFLLDKGLPSYINKFTIRMQEPITQSEIDKREALRNKVGVISDIMTQVSSVVTQDDVKLKILKTLLPDVVKEPEIINLLQEEIDRMETSKEDTGNVNGESNGEPNSLPNEPVPPSFGDENEPEFNEQPVEETDGEEDVEEPLPEPEEQEQPNNNEEERLPTFAELGVSDATNNNNF